MAPPPLSKFEGQAPVKGLRAWAAAYAKAINSNDKTYKSAASTLTRNGLTVMPQVDGSDVGFYYPGPVPLTPTKVATSGNRSIVSTCTWTKGFVQNRKTKLPAQKRLIEGVSYTMVRDGASWKVDTLNSSKSACASVSVKGVGW
ncbi:hypothetical protein [Knoellia koreensis]|uniref:Uncharacterized protein n=1 Tax=Knoellia koreensis TaxID=2730921 RepID=A0A849H3M9_9MICO|nr:hypothetical protein [Knoellia sp. DB2414S]NNM44396.1 hypothetical protein [Knoellia sp. DB2414S]